MNMIKRVKSKQFIKQIPGTFNRPIITICEDENDLPIYFIKYSRNSNEIDGLISEVICNFLAKELYLNTPDIAFVEIGDYPIDPNKFIHADCLKKGEIVFGSKRLENSSELTELNFVVDKHDFNRLAEPSDILRIGMFDLWIGNKDRTRRNFNIFINLEKEQSFYIFDHFEAFAKIAENVQTVISQDVDIFHGFLGSSYGYEMLCWLPGDELIKEMNEFIRFVRSFNARQELEIIIQDIPSTWKIKDETIDYIIRFLSSEERIQKIESETIKFIESLYHKS